MDLLSTMDLSSVVRYYVERMLKEVPGMKVLLLDADTTRIVSTVYSQSEILEQEVYLVERLDVDRKDQLFHLKVSQIRWLCWLSCSSPLSAADSVWQTCRLYAFCDQLEKILPGYAGSSESHAMESTTCVRGSQSVFH